MADLVKIFCMDLEKGMHVSSLDRPWLETSFVLQGFEITTDEDIQRLQKSCNYVYIDTGLSRLDETLIRRKVRTRRPRKTKQELFPKKTLKPYQDAVAWDDEYPKAQAAVRAVSQVMGVCATTDVPALTYFMPQAPPNWRTPAKPRD